MKQRLLEKGSKLIRERGVRLLLTALLVLPAIAYIAYRSYRNWDAIRSYPWTLQPLFGGLALLGYILAMLCVLLAWNLLMRRLAHMDDLRENSRIYCLSLLPRYIPGSVWYMAGRAYLYRQAGVAPSLTLTGTALEIILTAVAGLLTYLTTLPLPGPARPAPLQFGLALGLLVLLVLIVQPAIFNRVLAFLLRRLGSRTTVHLRYRDLVLPALMYIPAWWIGGATLYATIRAISYPLPASALAAIVGIWAVSSTTGMLASTFLFGLGIREVTVSVLLAALMPQPIAVVVAILYWFLLAGCDMTLAGAFLLVSRLQGRPLVGAVPPEPAGEQAGSEPQDRNNVNRPTYQR